VVLKDITDRKQAEEKMARSEERFRMAAQNASDLIYEVDLATGELQWFGDIEGMLGYQPGECRKELTFWKESLHPEDRASVFSGLEEAVKNRACFSKEYRIRRKDGSYLTWHDRATVLCDIDGRPLKLIGVCADMTERRKMQNMVLQSEKMAAVGQLAGGVAHEINNPLGIILGFSQSLVRRLKEGEAMAVPLKSIEREAIRCKGLVQDLLTFSRASRQERESGVDVNAAIQGSLSLIEARAKTANVEIVAETDPALPRVTANKNQLQQVIINLANNAMDAMPKGGTIFLRTRPSQTRDGGVEIQVQDTGSGVPSEIRGKIFEPFFTTKDVGKGTGLGLSLVYEIVKKHDGTIELDSEQGKGTTFTVFLPQEAAEHEPSSV
jgi:PAS domain S-box-containing protein